jgi:hypothetical protein
MTAARRSSPNRSLTVIDCFALPLEPIDDATVDAISADLRLDADGREDSAPDIVVRRLGFRRSA